MQILQQLLFQYDLWKRTIIFYTGFETELCTKVDTKAYSKHTVHHTVTV